ncbi:MAG TPA: hypothetical protein VHG71_12365 [Verrucomicrobiae bacterium]|nr:hypothetical protein [Verrucomicrobiae bacterium]
MNTSIIIHNLVIGCLFIGVGIFDARGLFNPMSRRGWGRFGGGVTMSTLSLCVWTIGLLFLGVDSILRAFHCEPLNGNYFMIFFGVWLAALFILGWRDHKKKHS